MATARAQLRTNLLHRLSAYRDTIDDLDNRITLATKSGTTELDFLFSLVPPASTTIPLGVVEDVAVGATYTREAAARARRKI